ncbi:ethanolamine utilization protein EutH [[Clostridium] colinum]|uniref:ethanolamine utilization protein EutH n=1 Tax=[Clostridium] colinum TaxID=36835 RepID=UPI002024ACDF|nr:ethanolamine utilization protein EutH [[Clostridium] colinum]
MSINEIILYIMVIFMVLGAIDKCIGNKFGVGEKFEEGIITMGALALSMVGVICLAPVLANILRPIVVPIFNLLGADPAMFAGSLLANDMGGAPLAIELANTPEAGLFGGLIVGAMMGPTIVFTIPVALGIIEKEDQKYLATGVLSGVITIPIGAFVGGLVAGFDFMMVFKNLIPIIIFAILIAVLLFLFEDFMLKAFTIFGKAVVIIITIGLVLAIIEKLTGIVIIKGLNPIEEGITIVGDIAIVLAGAFPLVYVITKVFKKPLLKLGQILKMNDVAAAGLIASLANSIPMFQMLKDMDNRGKIINVAFAVSAAFVFGDHLGFTAGFNKDMIFPMIVGKLVGGVTAIFVAIIMANKTLSKGK